jgi:hypothetical protein
VLLSDQVGCPQPPRSTTYESVVPARNHPAAPRGEGVPDSVPPTPIWPAALGEWHDIPAEDREALTAAAANPDRILDDPYFCLREFFVVTKERAPA